MKKIILVAYDLNPKLGSECGRANLWLKIISKYYFVEVFTDAIHKDDILCENYHNTNFNFIHWNTYLRRFLGKIGAHNISNIFFINNLKKEMKNLKLDEFSLLHCITPSGIHSYNDLYKFGIPILIGPIGGGLPTPKGFEKIFHDEYLKNSIRDIFYKYIVRIKSWKNYFLNAHTILLSTSSMNHMLPKIPKDKCFFIFNALVDTNYYIPVEKSANKLVKILFVGSLKSTKGILLLIEAANLCVKKSINNFVIEIAGDGPLKNKINYLIKKYNLENFVKLLGWLSKNELLKKYQQSDIFCLPTLREPGGNSLLEAMSCGLPVITSNYGGPAYSVTDECGIKINLVSYDDYINVLSDSILYLMKNKEVRLQMGKKARKKVEQDFSFYVLENKILNTYKYIIG